MCVLLKVPETTLAILFSNLLNPGAAGSQMRAPPHLKGLFVVCVETESNAVLDADAGGLRHPVPVCFCARLCKRACICAAKSQQID